MEERLGIIKGNDVDESKTGKRDECKYEGRNVIKGEIAQSWGVFEKEEGGRQEGKETNMASIQWEIGKREREGGKGGEEETVECKIGRKEEKGEEMKLR